MNYFPGIQLRVRRWRKRRDTLRFQLEVARWMDNVTRAKENP